MRDRRRAKLMRYRAGLLVVTDHQGNVFTVSKKPPRPGARWCDDCFDWHGGRVSNKNKRRA